MDSADDAGSADDLVSALERLEALQSRGFLTPAEATRAKERVLSGEDLSDLPGEVQRVGRGKHRRTLCLDFDGVLHSYRSGWRGPLSIPDPPVDGAIRFLTQAAERFDLAICSVRSSFPGAIEVMKAWLREHGLEERVLARIRFPVAKPPAELYLDDRGWRFTGTFPTFDELADLAPWTKKAK
ncbi:MAG TPA: hypothetical protein DEF51_00950 [Myxococcales bacterium]|nr:hypothetical protein [Myxococcales bacterium]